MTSVNPQPGKEVLREYETEIRVRYQETDAQGVVHHSTYLAYFEIGRVEMLRASGISYRELENNGMILVVAEAACRYRLPAFFDDLLTLKTTVIRSRGVRIEHAYEIRRSGELLVDGKTVVACLNKEGRVQRLPTWLQLD